jgi:hypothetical protein
LGRVGVGIVIVTVVGVSGGVGVLVPGPVDGWFDWFVAPPPDAGSEGDAAPDGDGGAAPDGPAAGWPPDGDDGEVDAAGDGGVGVPGRVVVLEEGPVGRGWFVAVPGPTVGVVLDDVGSPRGPGPKPADGSGATCSVVPPPQAANKLNARAAVRTHDGRIAAPAGPSEAITRLRDRTTTLRAQRGGIWRAQPTKSSTRRASSIGWSPCTL